MTATEPFEKVTVEWAVAPKDRRKARGFTKIGTATLLADDPKAVEHYRNGGKVLRYWRVESVAEWRFTELDPSDWISKYARSLDEDIQDCTCIEYCDEDPKTACNLSGRPHVHPSRRKGDGFGPCPVHPERPGDH
jgi:hypothetical protein